MSFENATRNLIESLERLSQAAEGSSTIVFASAELEHAQLTLDYCDAAEAEGLQVPFGLREHALATQAHYTS